MRDLLSYLALRIGVGLLGLLPVRAAQRVGTWGGLIFHRFASGRRDMARRHMARVLGEGGDPRMAARRMFYWYGRYWGEALWVRQRRIEELRSRLTCEGLEYIEKAKADGKGMIFALPHMGNWEIAAPLAVERDVAVVAVAEKLRNRHITSWFTAMRAEFGIEIVLATGTAEVMRRLDAALAENKAVALLADRDLRGRGPAVEFFGEETPLPQGPASLAVMTGAPLMAVGLDIAPLFYPLLRYPPPARARSESGI